MARAKAPPLTIDQPTLKTDAVRADLASLDAVTAINEETAGYLAQLSEELSVTLPIRYDEDLYVDIAKSALIDHSLAGWRLGVILLAMHSRSTSAADFAALAQDRIGLSKSQAYMYMATVKRFATEDGVKLLQRFRTSGISSFSKIALLQTRTNAEIEAMFDDEGLEGITADDVASMSVRQLQRALRLARTEIAKGSDQFHALDDKYKKATNKSPREASADPHGERVKRFEADLHTASFDAAKLIRKDVVDIVEALHAEETGEAARLQLSGVLEDSIKTATRQAFERVVTALTETAAHLGIAPQSVGLTGEEFMPADFK
jgi:hypothetical protein